MPVEDAAVMWPEDESPYLPVARITAIPQDTWADAMREAVEDRMAFNLDGPRRASAARFDHARPPACLCRRARLPVSGKQGRDL